MHNSLQRLYQTKLVLMATIVTAIGAGLMILATVQAGHLGWGDDLPLKDFGSTLFVTGVLGIFLNYLDKTDAEARAAQQLRTILAEQAPAMRDAVIDGFAFNAGDLARVSSPEVLDRITRNALAIQLGDVPFADDIYDDLKQQALGAGERREDLAIGIDLSPWKGEPSPGFARSAMYIAVIRWEYTVVPTSNIRRFSCVSDHDEFRELLGEPGIGTLWQFDPANGLDGGSKEAFEVLQFSVDGEARPIRRTGRASAQTYTVDIGKHRVDDAQPVRVSYTYRTLVARNEHALQIGLRQPTHGVHIDVRYDGAIGRVGLIDFLASSERISVTRSPETVQDKCTSLDFDGWAMPRSGVVIVW